MSDWIINIFNLVSLNMIWRQKCCKYKHGTIGGRSAVNINIVLFSDVVLRGLLVAIKL